VTLALTETLEAPRAPDPARDGLARNDPAPFVRKDTDGLKHLDLAVLGAHCAGCLRKIETGVGKLDGVEDARLNLSTGRMSVAWRGGLAPARITETLSGLGYESAPFDPETSKAEVDREGRKLLACLAVAGFAAGNIMLFSVGLWTASRADMGPETRDMLHWASALIALPAAAFAGRPFFGSAWRALKAGHANMDVPISLAVLLALGMSLFQTMRGAHDAYFDAASMLLFFLLIGRWLDHRLRYRANEAARTLLALQSVSTRRIGADGKIATIAAREVEPGDKLLIAPGDSIPVDAILRQGTSEFDLSLLTGESAPVALSSGAELRGGTLNLSARIVVEATARVEASLPADLARLIEAGTQSKARYVRLADKAAALYVPAVHTLAAGTFLVWWLLIGESFPAALMNGIAVLIITCPCALGLAVPAVQVVATGRLFRRGVLVKSGDALERLAEARAAVFDKTGTLTSGKPQLAPGQSIDARVMGKAAQLARLSRHPMAQAIAALAGPGDVAEGAEETPGQGITGKIDGVPARLGHKAFVCGEDEPVGAMELWFAIEGEPPQRFLFEDTLRADAPEAIRDLKTRGMDVLMLTGDGPEAAKRVAAELGIDDWRARVTPAAKVEALQSFEEKGEPTLMVGDGLNDAPSLAKAHVSMSPGTAADASQAAADFVIQGQSLGLVREAYDVSRAARRRIFENFAFAVLYNVLAVPLAALGLVTPMIAAAAMSGSSMIVTLNALRLAAPGGQK
jgi:Cu2+-exporting ATPase